MGGDSGGDSAKASVGDGHTRRVLHRLLAVPELPVSIAFPFGRGMYEMKRLLRCLSWTCLVDSLAFPAIFYCYGVLYRSPSSVESNILDSNKSTLSGSSADSASAVPQYP